MGTVILELKEGVGEVTRIAEYSIPPKKALVAFIEQEIRKNYNTWEYPEMIKGMRESKHCTDHWYFDDIKGKRVLAAAPA